MNIKNLCFHVYLTIYSNKYINIYLNIIFNIFKYYNIYVLLLAVPGTE